MHNIATERTWTEAMLRFRFAGQVTAVLVLLGWVAWFFPFDDLVDRYFRGKLVGGEYTLLTELLQNRENLINFNQKKASWNLQPERDELSEKNWA